MAPAGRKKGIYILAEETFSLVYGEEEQRDIARLVDVLVPPQTRASIEQNPEVLAEAEIILSGWGGPILDAAFLQAAPRLKLFLYGAGATGGMIYPEVWQRGVRVTTAAQANAIPVAEFTLASIILALKSAIPLSRQTHRERAFPQKRGPMAGAYGSTVGLVSLGMIGRAVLKRLRTVLPQVSVLAYDPYIPAEEIACLGATSVSLETLFRRSDVVSLHTPRLPETEGLVRGRHLRAMKPHATLINTARGGIIAQEEMIPVLEARPDLTAMLDVADPEPLEPDCPLYTLPNVFLTPHIAGSMENECRRMGRHMVDELQRYCRGEALRWELRQEMPLQHTIHRLPIPK